MTGKPQLRLDWCSHKAALYAVTHWHYSKAMPASKTVKIGVWEGGRFIGCVIFSPGANPNYGKGFGLTMNEICELTRVALDRHETPVSRILKIAVKMLRTQSPGLRLILSYADCDENHHGGIYAASGWLYLGKVGLGGGTPRYRVRGRIMHSRTICDRGWHAQLAWLRANVDPRTQKILTTGKHKYVLPLDGEMRAKLAPLAQPYPKRAASIGVDAPADQAGEGGSTPTAALQL